MALTSSRHPVARVSGLVGAVSILAACSVNPSSADASRKAGEQYGKTIEGTIGSRLTDSELEKACGKGLVDGDLVQAGSERSGDETDLELDAFVEGCTSVLTENG